MSFIICLSRYVFAHRLISTILALFIFTVQQIKKLKTLNTTIWIAQRIFPAWISPQDAHIMKTENPLNLMSHKATS